MQESIKTESKINWYVISIIFIIIVAYDIANSVEPSIEGEFDFFEITRMLGFLAVALFSFVVAIRYWLPNRKSLSLFPRHWILWILSLCYIPSKNKCSLL